MISSIVKSGARVATSTSRSSLSRSQDILVRYASGKTAPEDGPSYFERKRAVKEERVRQYQAEFERAAALKQRRSNVPNKGSMKQEFQEWWDAKMIQEQKWDREARQQGKDWKIEVAVILERLPQILPDLKDYEKEFDELQAYLAQFGKDYPKEFSAALPESGTAPVSNEDLLALLPEGFKPAPRETEADASGKTDTVDRKLKDIIYFLVDGKLPTTALNDPESESLLEAAKRAVQENGGKTLDLYCPSNAPVAVHMTKENDGDAQYYGTKTFFLRLQYDEGEIQKQDLKNKEFQWLDRNEVLDAFRQNQEEQVKFFRYVL